MSEIVLARVCAQPNRETFKIPPIRDLVARYAVGVSLDPFAGSARAATVTNDLHREADADYHLPAGDFLLAMVIKALRPNVVFFDPPYSLRQLKECYHSVGIGFSKSDGWKPNRWTAERDLIAELAPEHVLSFGWSSAGMGKKRGYEVVEVLLVCHGAGHHDTICVAERRAAA